MKKAMVKGACRIIRQSTDSKVGYIEISVSSVHKRNTAYNSKGATGILVVLC